MAVGRRRHCTGSRLCSGLNADVENVNAMRCGRRGTRSAPGKMALNISDAVERLFRAGGQRPADLRHRAILSLSS